MAGTVNKVILVGNLGKDPEVRRIDTDVMVASFPLATSEVFVDRNTGEKKELTDWHDIVLWRGLAETAERYLRKGMKIYVEGKLKKRSWQDKEGNARYSTEIIAENLTMLSRPESTVAGTPEKVFSSDGTLPTPPRIDHIADEADDQLPF